MTPRRILLLTVACSAFVFVACDADDRIVKLGHSIADPAETIAEAVAETLGKHRFDVQIESSSDSATAIQAILEGRLDLAIIEEPDQPLPNLMTLSPLYPSVLHVLYRGSTQKTDLADVLDGSSVYAGPIGGTAGQLLAGLVVDFDIPRDSFRLLDNPWTESPDVFFILGGLLDPNNVAELSGYELFSFASDDDVVGGSVADGIALRHHHVRPFLLPKGIYPGLSGGATLTLSTRTILIAREDFDEQLAFEVVSALFANAQEISQGYPLVTHELSDDVDGTNLMLPLHAGTQRYQDRDRPGFVERNVDLIALYLTIALALLSGGIALYRSRLQVKKDRIDVFYRRLLAIRKSMAADDTSNWAELKQQVLAVQEEVLELLVSERIAADDSLVAFVNLAGQMLNEVDQRARNTGAP